MGDATDNATVDVACTAKDCCECGFAGSVAAADQPMLAGSYAPAYIRTGKTVVKTDVQFFQIDRCAVLHGWRGLLICSA